MKPTGPKPRSKAASHDVVIVGAGPGGSSAACFLARRGVRVLLLDKAAFPREKVCGDGLTPQAIYWLDRLGCVDEVLAETRACIKDCDLYVNGEHVLTGGFPRGTFYPDFATLLDRRRFDNILLENAIAAGAEFAPGHNVRAVERDADGVTIQGRRRGEEVSYRAPLVIGADGANSVVSRSIGNAIHAGATAVSLRTYYDRVDCGGAQIKVWFDRDFFPGYGWLFVDDEGFANIGLGYAFSDRFPLMGGLRGTFKRFIDTHLEEMLEGAEPCGTVGGGTAFFYKPRRIVEDRVLLVGDAANQTDPLNGGGIHKAMESAFFAAEAAAQALEHGDFSRRGLIRYEERWGEHFELDRRTGEIFLQIALNPDLKDFCLFVLKQIGRLTREDPRFQDFCSGVFSGVIAHDACLSPRALYHAFPKDPRVWMSLVQGRHGVMAGSAGLAAGALGSLAAAGTRMARHPIKSLDWGLDVATRTLELLEHGLWMTPAGARGAPDGPPLGHIADSRGDPALGSAAGRS